MALLDLTVNGQDVQVEAPDAALLLDVLRERLALTGAKRGCETSHCGCCTVRVDGMAVHSCVVLAARCSGKEITTVEGCGDGMELDRLQQSFLKHGAVQCGYCGPGMLMAAQALLERNPRPTLDEVKKGLDGNLCRCTGYTPIFDAIMAYARGE